MRDFIAVAIGGMLGSVSRHAVNLSIAKLFSPGVWPLATLLVNVFGCLGIGILGVTARRAGWLDTSWELAVRVGFLGGLTTFSSLGLEVVRLWHDGRIVAAALVIALNLVLGIGAVIVGEQIARGIG